MKTNDFFDFFKLNILKNSWLYFLLISWLIFFTDIQAILFHLLPASAIEFFNNVYKYLLLDNLIIPLNILRFVFWLLAFRLFQELWGRFTAYKKRGRYYKFTPDSWKKDWIFNGKTKLLFNPVRLRVNSSRAGCLYRKHLWKNFEMKFKMRSLVDEVFFQEYVSCIGIIFRAKDLQNYFMLEIFVGVDKKEDKEIWGIWLKPHIRYHGMWEFMSLDGIYLFKQNESKLFKEWMNVKLIVDDNVARLTINDFDEYDWILPTHVDVNHIESGTKKEFSSSAEKDEFGTKNTDLPRIDFKDFFGMIGFRAHLNQGAEVKNLTVKKLP